MLLVAVWDVLSMNGWGFRTTDVASLIAVVIVLGGLERLIAWRLHTTGVGNH
jgi:hypothetical protein